MAAITDYASLSTALADWAERTVDVDQMIGLAEAEFKIYLGPNFAKETHSTLTFTAGSASLPMGFVRCLALTHATYGGLSEVGIGVIRNARVAGNATPSRFAITGSTVEIDTSSNDSAVMDYEGTLTGLSGGNTTNWLLSNAPQAYLSMCRSMVEARATNLSEAGVWRSAAMQTLSDLGIQSMVGQFGRATVNIPGSTP